MRYWVAVAAIIMVFLVACEAETPPPSMIGGNGSSIIILNYTTIIYNTTIINGTQGPQGPAGLNGTNGINGMNGTDGSNGHDGTSVFMSSITDFFNGTFIWHFSDGFNFTTSDLTGPPGPSGNGTSFDKGNETIIELQTCDGLCTTIIEVEYI